MSLIKLKLAARCEAAGRPNSKNEDNFQLGNNLSDGKWSFIGDEVISLDEKGALMVVCDGMGGMNAGEKASEIAVNTIKTLFEPEQISSDVISSPDAVRRHIEKAIVTADAKIKEEARADKAKEGMGSTVVLAWIIGDSVYVGWCGDSRAYRFNPVSGLEQLSHDHSYVQELVDAGKLTPDLAFDHPSNNIITRSLGDPRQKARPDVKSFPLNNGDIILLCSDGLCGVLRNAEIETLIAGHTESMNECLNALWYGAQNAGWHDNVTIALCRILSGAKTPNSADVYYGQQKDVPKKTKTKQWLLTAVIAFVMLLAGLLAGYFLFNRGEKTVNRETLLKEVTDLLEKYKPTGDSCIDINMYRVDLKYWAGKLESKNLPDSCFKLIYKEYIEFDRAKLDSLYEVRHAKLCRKRREILLKNSGDSIIKGIDTAKFITSDDENKIDSISKILKTGVSNGNNRGISNGESGNTTPPQTYLRVQRGHKQYLVYPVPQGAGWSSVLKFAQDSCNYRGQPGDEFIDFIGEHNEGFKPELYKGKPPKQSLQINDTLYIFCNPLNPTE
ncbi:MAG: protein phosphatase 2C domain-containing protein [Prevotellaceae bacterium]|jgi:serine/threonine protein phosphatase PrpC|nr:protein phosphatase 2C domain-containing protein [Prevotellaceae bacterium]